MNPKIITFAIESHADTNHLYAGSPYSVHLAMVASICQKFIDLLPKEDRMDAFHACWCHDLIEDARVSYNDLKKVAGERIADIVYAVTNERGKTREQRASDNYYEGIRANHVAAFVKLCDRTANVIYGNYSGSDMLDKYRKENDHFIERVCTPKQRQDYKKLIDYLNESLKPL